VRPAVTVGRIAAAALFVLAAGCARRVPPSGGPPDLLPPVIRSSDPDSGAAGVPLDATLTVTFTEPMEPRATGESVALAPRIEFAKRQWHGGGRSLTLVLAEPMEPNQTYTLFIGRTARDRHGNTMTAGGSRVFSTAESFPAGRIEGKLEAKGFAAPGTFIWTYAGGRSPDSTARDFDALGLVDADGRFRVDGLPAPERYHVWAFADLNNNRSFEPDIDVLAPADTTIELRVEAPTVTGFDLDIVNPHAPGSVRGTVIDSLRDSVGVVRVMAVGVEDSTLRVAVDATGADLAFEVTLPPGEWVLRAFRDLDKNRNWQPDRERASEPRRMRIQPTVDMVDQKFVLRREPGGP
jgi:hypothetical protein